MDEAERRRAQEGAEDAQARLDALLAERLAAGSVDGSAPSRLPGWSVGHVLTHVARNADGIVRVLLASETGEVVERYPGGQATRDGDIEAGNARLAADLVGDVRATGDRLRETWSAQTRWDGRSREVRGVEIPVVDLPMVRWREVEVHTVDLGLGVEAADWPSLFVRLELRAMEMRWRARRPMGMSGLPPEALVVDPRTRLAWLYGRTEISGLGPAGVL